MSKLWTMSRLGQALLFVIVCQAPALAATDWVRAGLNTNQPVWGVRGGLLWALPPAGFRGREPRGLIRLGYPVLEKGGYDLINFIAIEPIVSGHRGFSEMERSAFDGLAGKRMQAQRDETLKEGPFEPGHLERSASGLETLAVNIQIEKFDNGAHVRLTARQVSDKPDELALSVSTENDSRPLECCILTATMGNMARTRVLWLKHRVQTSLELYSLYKGPDFASHVGFPLPDLYRNRDGDVLVALTTDESDPGAVYPFPGSDLWHYAGRKVTQYWRLPREAIQEDLRAVVNGRYMYWRSRQPVPGGIAFENFELRQEFREGQTFVFGITPRTPGDLGLGL